MAKLTIRIDDMSTISPETDNQRKFFRAWKNDIHLLHGCAGTGKSFISLYKAIETVLDRGNQYEKVVLIRSAVATRDIGALPGNLKEKGEIYELPYKVMVDSLFNKPMAYSRLIEQGHLEFMLSSYIRGLTFDDSIIIVDEIQNMSYQELHTVMTRIGLNSKLLLCGDTKQNDLGSKSGLDKFMKILYTMPSVNPVEFGVDDIVRSGIVREFLIAENKYEKTYNTRS